MGATTPHEVDELWTEAFRRRDADAVAELYEEFAVYVMAMAGIVLEGREAIRANVREMFAVMEDTDLVYDDHDVVVTGDYAFTHGTSVSRFRIGDEEHSDATRTTAVYHRGPDGLWRFVIDHAS